MLSYFSLKHLNIASNVFYNLFSSPPWNYSWLTLIESKNYLLDLVNTPRSISYVFSIADQACGFCFGVSSACSPVPIYDIKEIFVSSKLQHQGIGTRMLNDIEIDLGNNGINAVKLSTLRTIPAFAFYLKNGYKEIDASVNMFKVFRAD